MIALILATKNDIPSDFTNSTLIGVSSLTRRTLWLIFIAVVPLSVLSNWEKQIQDHCVPNTLSYAVYYGSGRDLSAKDLQKYDIVVTTYQIVVGEHSGLADEAMNKKRRKNKGSLFEVQWKVLILSSSVPYCIMLMSALPQRVILDEGHIIRNPKTKMARSVCDLKAQRRWVLTGTPIVSPHLTCGIRLTSFMQINSPQVSIEPWITAS